MKVRIIIEVYDEEAYREIKGFLENKELNLALQRTLQTAFDLKVPIPFEVRRIE